MAWARLDDNFPDHPKVLPLSDGAFRVHVAGLCYAQRTNTRGRVPKQALPLLRARTTQVRELVTQGLWDASGDGWEIHDFLEYNPERTPSSDLSSKREAAGRLGGQRSGEARRSKPREANGEATVKQKRAFASEPPVPSHPTEETDVSSYGRAREAPVRVRELRDDWLSRLPGKFQRDVPTFDDFELLAEDYQDDPEPVLSAITEIKREGGIPFPSQIRKRLPPLPGKVIQHPAANGRGDPAAMHAPDFGPAPPGYEDA